MFERYTETARRTIFFARYEASQFGGPYIETEFLLLGLLREDKALANRFLGSHAAVQAIRKRIEGHRPYGEKVATSVDLPLSHECKRALAYAAEESERLGQKHIGTAHLLLGLLREEGCFAAELLREHGVTADMVREQVQESETPAGPRGSSPIAGFNQWLVQLRAESGRWTVQQRRFGNRTHFAFYAGGEPKEVGEGEDVAPAEKLAQIQQRIHLIVDHMEHAIANHEFEKARLYSGEERKERELLRALCEQFNLEAPPPRVPRLCIVVIDNDLFSEVRQRCEGFIAEGVAEVWLLDPAVKRAYTITKDDGLREFKGEILRITDPPLEMYLEEIFD